MLINTYLPVVGMTGMTLAGLELELLFCRGS